MLTMPTRWTIFFLLLIWEIQKVFCIFFSFHVINVILPESIFIWLPQGITIHSERDENTNYHEYFPPNMTYSTSTPQSDAWSFLYKILGGILSTNKVSLIIIKQGFLLELILRISSCEVFPIFSPKLGSGEGGAITLETRRRLQGRKRWGGGGRFCGEGRKIQKV